MGPGRAVTALLAACVVALGPAVCAAPVLADPAPVPTPLAPTPTSTAASPAAPDPAPPAGGVGPGGLVPGGGELASRGLLVPSIDPPPPAGTTAAAWALVDLGRGTVLAARDAHGRYQPASVLKTLTALTLLPRLPDGTPVPVSEQAADTEGSAVGLVPGGAYTSDVLFAAMLLMSGNDATEALTAAAGGDAAVVAAMNTAVRGLGGYDTVVQTPTGLDGWSQLTSAYDLALVLRAAVADPRLLAYDGIRRTLLPAQSVPKDGKPVGTIELDNQSSDFLDGCPGALYAKTGFTDAARHTFLGAARRGDTTLGVVLLRAERAPTDQWQQASALLDWGFGLGAAAPSVGTLDDAATLAARAQAAPTSRPAGTPAPSGPRATATAATPTAATPTAGARATRLAAVAPRPGPGPLPWVYAGLAGAFVVAVLALDRRRRRRR